MQDGKLNEEGEDLAVIPVVDWKHLAFDCDPTKDFDTHPELKLLDIDELEAQLPRHKPRIIKNLRDPK